MLGVIVKVLRTASIVICLIVIASFAVFAVDQTKNASAAQQAELGGAPTTSAATQGARPTAPSTSTTAQTTTTPPKHESSVRETLDEASNSLTSPFAGIVSSSDSEWATRGVRMLLALLVYGFGLGYLARVLRIRV